MPAVVETKAELVERLRGQGEEIRALGVRRLGLFGSFARGEQAAGSDVDLLVEFEPGLKTYDNFLGLAFLVEEVLQRPVELVTRESLSPYLGPRILSEVENVPLGP